MSTNIVFEYINMFSFIKEKAIQVKESYLLAEHFRVVILYNLMMSLHVFPVHLAIRNVRTDGTFLRE